MNEIARFAYWANSSGAFLDHIKVVAMLSILSNSPENEGYHCLSLNVAVELLNYLSYSPRNKEKYPALQHRVKEIA